VNSKEAIDERHLLGRLAEGDLAAFRLLYDHYHNKVFFYVLRFTGSRQLAEDILQEVFIKVWVGRNKMKDIRSLDAWLFTLAKHKIINGFKRLSLEYTVIAQMADSMVEPVDATTQVVDYNEIKRALQTAIEQLPPQQKIVYRLRREHGLKNDEIASKLNISPLTVKKHIAQASQAIRVLLAKQTSTPVALLVVFLKLF
jgi:RNA polymerase sigma-70 factor (ECF subfamily)